MTDLYADIAWASLNKHGENLCGDHVEIAGGASGTTIVVLADGLGSGVKANILSTLTAKILATMLAEGLSIEVAIDALLRTLPVCEERHIAYSTFTIAVYEKGGRIQLIEYDNPPAMLLRAGQPTPIVRCEMDLQDKHLTLAEWQPQSGDVLMFFSDGAIHASQGEALNLNWDVDDIAQYMMFMFMADYNAQTLVDILLSRCHTLYGEQPGDDTTVCGVLFRERSKLTLMIGPPFDPADDDKIIREFLASEGQHVLCGGTTADVCAKYLGKTITCDPFDDRSDVPPICYLEGIDLVTEGVVTMSHAVQNIREIVEKRYDSTQHNKANAAGKLTEALLQATDISFFVGSAVNVAHQNQGEHFTFSYKMRQMEDLAHLLRCMGKDVTLRYC